jgi:hypothetical protein
MKRTFAVALLTVNLLTSAAARADAPDLSSPKAAAKSLYAAVERGDSEGIRAVFFTETDAQRQLADAYAEMILASKRLADVAKQKYAGAAAADAFAQGAVTAEDVKRIDAAELRQDAADRASLHLPLASRPMNFRKTDRGWQLVISDFAGGAPDKIDGQVAMTREIATVVTEIADGIESDKFPTPQEAEQAIQHRMNEVMTRAVRKNMPTTSPATQPATTPAQR